MARRIGFWLFVIVVLLLFTMRSLLPGRIDFSVWYLGALDIPVREPAQLLWSEIILPCAYFVDKHLDNVLTWPVAVILVAYLLLRSGALPSLLPSTFKRVKTLNLFGLQVELSEQLSEIVRERDDLSKAIFGVREKLKLQIRQKVHDANITPSFEKLVKSIGSQLKVHNRQFDGGKCRATIHIEDPIFADQLMQLLEYASGEGVSLAGMKAGRSFSMRRGIVGRVWRSQIPEIEGVLPEDLSKGSDTAKLRHIAQIWGMTLEEAKEAVKYPSYIGVPFAYSGSRHAVFYMDSTAKNAFPRDEQTKASIITFIEHAVNESRLDSAIGDLVVSLDVDRQQIPILEPWNAK